MLGRYGVSGRSHGHQPPVPAADSCAAHVHAVHWGMPSAACPDSSPLPSHPPRHHSQHLLWHWKALKTHKPALVHEF